MCADSVQPAGPLIRIGELSRRVGVGIDTLRAWERRYGVFEPTRSPGGFRLYSERDQHRARKLKAMIDSGLSARDAAAAVLESDWPQASRNGSDGPEAPSVDALLDAIARLDEEAANAILDRGFATLSFDGLAQRLILPALQGLGEAWERGEITVGQEHFASNLLRGRLMGFARGWSAGGGPVAVLACPPAEYHDLGLIVFGLALKSRGWRVVFLGADTPPATVAEAAEQVDADLIAIAALDPKVLRGCADELRAIAAARPLVIGGAPASAAAAHELGAQPLEGDPVTEARRLTAERFA